MKFNVFLYFLVISLFNFSLPQTAKSTDIEILQSKFQLAVEKNLASKPINDIIVEIGRSFIGSDYIAHSLEINDEEKLVINLHGFDCTTFLETVLAVSRCIRKNDLSFEAFKGELQFIRYRGGVIEDYPSRLHYFTDWIYDNQKKGVVSDITEKLGGIPFKPELSFMSGNPEYYRHLKNNRNFIDTIRKHEARISKRDYSFIPKDHIHKIEDKILNGDIIAFTTNIKGLDIAHLAIAVKDENGKVHLMHASQLGVPVHISEKTLTGYIDSVSKFNGIMVIRAAEIKTDNSG